MVPAPNLALCLYWLGSIGGHLFLGGFLLEIRGGERGIEAIERIDAIDAIDAIDFIDSIDNR